MSVSNPKPDAIATTAWSVDAAINGFVVNIPTEPADNDLAGIIVLGKVGGGQEVTFPNDVFYKGPWQEFITVTTDADNEPLLPNQAYTVNVAPYDKFGAISPNFSAATKDAITLQVVEADIADDAVTTDKVEDEAITNAKISSLTANKITAGTITGSTLRTAASGKRFEVSTADNEAHFYGDRGDGTVENLATVGVTPADEVYTTGTAAVTNGSATVTGTGTAWNSISDANFFTVQGSGSIYPISSVDSDTQITLGSSYNQATATGVTYQITDTQDNTIAKFGTDESTNLAVHGVSTFDRTAEFVNKRTSGLGAAVLAKSDSADSPIGLWGSVERTTTPTGNCVAVAGQIRGDGTNGPQGGNVKAVAGSLENGATGFAVHGDTSGVSGLDGSYAIAANGDSNLTGGIVYPKNTFTSRTLPEPVATGGLTFMAASALVDEDFTTAGDWTFGSGWSHDSGNGEADASSPNGKLELYIPETKISGMVFSRVRFTVKNYVSGSVRWDFSGTNSSIVSSNGTYTATDVTVNYTGSWELSFESPSNDFVGTIDDVLVQLDSGLVYSVRYGAGWYKWLRVSNDDPVAYET